MTAEFAQWQIERLDRHHDRSAFDCGHAVLDEWLKRSAGQYQRRGYAQTFVATRPNERAVVGYYALANHAMSFDSLPQHLAKGLPPIDVPVVLLGRLAVDRSTQGEGLGGFLLLDAFRRITNISEQVGVRAIEVHAIDESAKRFYERFGFVALRDDPLHLSLNMDVVRKL